MTTLGMTSVSATSERYSFWLWRYGTRAEANIGRDLAAGYIGAFPGRVRHRDYTFGTAALPLLPSLTASLPGHGRLRPAADIFGHRVAVSWDVKGIQTARL